MMVYGVCLPSMLTMTFPTKPYSSFFLLGNLLLCNCKYENLMIRSQSEPNQSYSPWGALSTMSSKTCLITSMIKDRIGQHNVLLPINHNYNKICDISGIFASIEKQAINTSM